MKKIGLLRLSIISLVTLSVSCNNLDLGMDSTKLNYSGTGTPLIIRGQLTTAYNLLISSNSVFAENYWGYIGCMDTDEGFRNSVSNQQNMLNSHANMSTSASQLSNFWKMIWQSNEAATGVLAMVKTVEGMKQREIDEIVGQALVLQAFCHYYAAINFGPVPIKNIATFDMAVGQEIPRSPIKDVMQFCLDNCRKAIPLLPDIRATRTTAKITKSAAEALSYRIALYMASHNEIKDVSKYDEIVTWADDFIAYGPNKLNTRSITVNNEVYPAYARLFINNMADNQNWDADNNPEGIWDAIFYCKSTTSGIYANMGYEALMRLGRDMGVPCADDMSTSPIGFADLTYRASNNLYNAYTDFKGGVDYPVGDLRRDWNIPTFSYKYKSNDTKVAEGYGVKSRFPFFDVIMPTGITWTKKASLLPVFDKTTWNNETNANLLEIYVEQGGEGYSDVNGRTTFDITIAKGAAYTMGDYNPAHGIVLCYASAAGLNSTTDINSVHYGMQNITAKNNSTALTIHVEGGSITSVEKVTPTAANIGVSFVCAHARGIGKWRREFEVNVPPVREKDKTSCNMPILRFADVLLMAAEAHLMAANGNQAKGLEYLNMVRRRAYGKNVSTADATVDFSELTLRKIQDERMRELCFEGVRRADLIRWGSYTAPTGQYNAVNEFLDANPNVVNINYPMKQMQSQFVKYQLLPIPQDELSAAPNTMYQNPGW